MVLGIITSIAACPAIIGTTEAVRQGQRQNAKEKHRSRKANLQVTCNDPSRKASEVHGGTVVLKNNKLYCTNVNPRSKFLPPKEEGGEPQRYHPSVHGHLFAGYFFPYPGSQWGKRGEGYVSTIADDPPQLNWIYVDKDTYEVKYGLKTDTIGQHVGPWNVTPIDKRLNFCGWEGFCVVEEWESGENEDAWSGDGIREEGEGGVEGRSVWALYFDYDDDGLAEKVSLDRRVMEVELWRKEVRMQRGDCIF